MHRHRPAYQGGNSTSVLKRVAVDSATLLYVIVQLLQKIKDN